MRKFRAYLTECSLVLGLLLSWYYVVQVTIVRGSSMSPTLESGDRVIVLKWIESRAGRWGRSIQRQDIVQIRRTKRSGELLVKRVVGLPGDRIRIRNEEVLVNDRLLPEPYKTTHRETDRRGQFDWQFPREPAVATSQEVVSMLDNNTIHGALLVPRDRYFVLGDNRPESKDSRHFGLIAKEEIAGVAELVIWSVDPDACQQGEGREAGGCLYKALRMNRFLHLLRRA